MDNVMNKLRFCLVKTSLIAAVASLAYTAPAQHSTPSDDKESKIPQADSCMGMIPGDISDLLSEIKALNIMVEKKQLTPAAAESLFKKRMDKSTKGDPTAERLVLLLANENLSR